MERITDSPDGQADVSAQEAASRQGARVPRPHEDGGRPARDRDAAREGPEAAHGLTGERSHNPLRLVMLSHPADFARLAEGSVGKTHPLLVGRFVRTDLDQTRFGLATGKRLGGAVVRNRVRRRLREALRVMAPSFQPGWDVLIIARPAIIDADHHAMVGALRRVLRSGGVLGGRTES
jgi:ribonuclease P protein component